MNKQNQLRGTSNGTPPHQQTQIRWEIKRWEKYEKPGRKKKTGLKKGNHPFNHKKKSSANAPKPHSTLSGTGVRGTAGGGGFGKKGGHPPPTPKPPRRQGAKGGGGWGGGECVLGAPKPPNQKKGRGGEKLKEQGVQKQKKPPEGWKKSHLVKGGLRLKQEMGCLNNRKMGGGAGLKKKGVLKKP